MGEGKETLNDFEPRSDPVCHRKNSLGGTVGPRVLLHSAILGGAKQFTRFSNQLFLASMFEICMLDNPYIKVWHIPFAVHLCYLGC